MSSTPQQPLPNGFIDPWSTQGQYNIELFVIKAALAKMQTATLVQVKSCTNDGGVSPFGTVDVVPMVAQIDGAGNITPHLTVFELPYLRIQGGANAVIIDPQPGDIGIAVFASRDISNVKTTQSPAAPGSFRSYDWGDGMYLGGVLNGTPTQYLRFASGGVEVVSPTQVTLTAPAVRAGASGGTPQALMTAAWNQYWLTIVMPFLAGLGFTGGPPPTDGLTVDTEVS